MSIEENEVGHRRFTLQSPLVNPAFDPGAKSGLETVQVFEAGTVVEVSCREIDTGYETFATDLYYVRGRLARGDLANDLRKLDTEASE